MNTNNLQKLPALFYQCHNVVAIAKGLLGKLLFTCIEDETTTARIVETEAYNGVIDKASHAYGGRRTTRIEVTYAAGVSSPYLFVLRYSSL
jgi:DNA-3-methyladenine glycosylase